jgi:uncharacterized protein YkwD
MKSIKLSFVLISFVFVLFTSCTPGNDDFHIEKVNDIQKQYSEIDLEILNLVNDFRNSIDLNSLEKMNIISSVAETHTDYMVQTGLVNHDFFLERQESLMKSVQAISVAENVAYGYKTAQDVVNAWLKSDLHREVIENPRFTHFGISSEKNNEGRLFYTQIFINR